MIDTISQEDYDVLRLRALADPDNADKVCLFHTAQLKIENGTLKLKVES